MRIGFYNGYSIWGGGEKWHLEMAEYCQERGDEVFIYSPNEGELSQRSQAVGFTTRDISIGKYSYFSPSFFFKTKKIIERDHLDVLVFNSYRDVRAAAFAIKSAGVKKVILRCGMPIAPKESLSYKLNFLKGLDFFVPISKAILNEFKVNSPSLVREEKCYGPISNGIDLKNFSYVGETSKDLVVLGNASRLSDQKGLDMLLRALRILNERKVPFLMKIAGTGEDEEKLKALTNELDLNERVEFLGHIDNVADFVKSIDIYAFTSKYEGTARSMIEAMACGKPVVAFNASSMKEVVIHNECGLLARAFDVDDFADQLQKLIESKSMREKFSMISRKRVEEYFSKEKNFAHWYKFLNGSI